MPIHYEIDPQINLITIVFRGTICLEDLKAHKKNIVNDPLYHPEYDIITDLRDCHMDIPNKDRESYGKETAALHTPDHGRNAILANIPIEVAHGMVFSSHPQTIEKTQVFATPEAAYQWLKKTPENPMS